MVPIGNPTTPEIVYGFGLSTGYKNFDISTFLQGVANESFWIDVSATTPFAAFKYSGESVSGRLQNQVLKQHFWMRMEKDWVFLLELY